MPWSSYDEIQSVSPRNYFLFFVNLSRDDFKAAITQRNQVNFAEFSMANQHFAGFFSSKIFPLNKRLAEISKTGEWIILRMLSRDMTADMTNARQPWAVLSCDLDMISNFVLWKVFSEKFLLKTALVGFCFRSFLKNQKSFSSKSFQCGKLSLNFLENVSRRLLRKLFWFFTVLLKLN